MCRGSSFAGRWKRLYIEHFNLNSLTLGRCDNYLKSIIFIPFFGLISTEPHWWCVKIGSGNGLVPAGNKPLPGPMLTRILCPCFTDRRCHGAHTAYEKINRYAARSPRWFGGTSPAPLFRMCCVSTAYQWRMGDAHAAHIAYEWRCHCVWCRVWELDHCVFTAQVAYAQRTSHERAAVNAILWRMTGVCTAHGLRTCRTYEYTS